MVMRKDLKDSILGLTKDNRPQNHTLWSGVKKTDLKTINHGCEAA